MEAAPPKSVRSFLGMANFSSPFILQYSTINSPLRELTKKNATFRWAPAKKEAYQKMKKSLSADTVMAYFDTSRETKVIVDGSKKDRVSSILAQKYTATGQHRVNIQYDSRAMTAPEKNYAPIEVESLAILFALQKNLHRLKHFMVSTDHKPLVTLYSQYRKDMLVRVQKHKIVLQGKYSFTVVWEAGKDNPAEYNSRHPGQTSVEEAADETEIAISSVVCESIPDALTVQMVAQAMEADPKMRKLRQAVHKGHLDTTQNPQLKEYARFFEALSVIDGVVCRAEKILVPESLQKQVVEIAHEAHQGITKMKQYVRATMWFPRMDIMIEDHLRNCQLCQAAIDDPQKEPIHPAEMPREHGTPSALTYLARCPQGNTCYWCNASNPGFQKSLSPTTHLHKL